MASAQTETGSNIWSQLLAESSQKRFVYEPKTVLVLGDRNSGKTSLIASLQDLDVIEATAPHSTPGAVPLHYTYLDVYPTNDTDDVLTRLHIWTLDGDSEAVENHSALLNLALDERSLSNYAECLILITLDFSEPWHLESSLRFWLRVLKNHIETLKPKLSKKTFSTLQRQNAAAFKSYSEDTPSPSDPSSAPLPSKLRISSSADPSQTLNSEESESDEPVLGEDVLKENLGVPIVVVGCKSDLISTLLSREYHYRDDQELIYIQTSLRRICLQYGASLFYGAARKRVNIDALKEYLTHRLYNFPFKREPVTRYVASSASSSEKSVASSVVVDDDEEGNKKYAVLVPTGWDSKAKIDLEFNSQSLTKDPGQPYKEVIAEPKRASVPGVGASLGLIEEEKAEDDQEFLKRQLEVIETKKTSAPTPTATISATASPPVARAEHLPMGSPSPSSSPSLVSAARAAAEATGSPSKLSGPAVAKSSGTPAPAGAMSAEDRQNEHKVLADFFTTLMNGGRLNAARPGTAPGTPVGSKIMPSTGSPSRTDAEKSMKNLSNRD